MADSRISNLPAGDPIVGSELVAVVQGGVTKKVPASTLKGAVVVGAKGDKGDKGDPGPVGPVGATGATGATGSPGAQGLPGATGEKGISGNYVLTPTSDILADLGVNALSTSLSLRVETAGTYSNLKFANGSSAPAIVVSPLDVTNPAVYFLYDKATDSWSKVVKTVDVETPIKEIVGGFATVDDYTKQYFPSVGSGIWSGTIGGDATIVANTGWNRSSPIVVLPGSILYLRNYNVLAAVNNIAIILGADDKIIQIVTAGSGFATGNFDITIPSGAAKVLLNINNQNAARPISGAVVEANAPQIEKRALNEVYEGINPLIPVEEVGINKIVGLLSGGGSPGTTNGAIYIHTTQISGFLKTVDFRVNVAGEGEIILFVKNGSSYDLTVVNKTLAVGSNIHEFNVPFVGRVGLRCKTTAKYATIATGGPGISSVALTSLGIGTSDPTPATISANLVEQNNLPTYDISLIVSYQDIVQQNVVLKRLDDLERSTPNQLEGSKVTFFGDSITALSQGNTYASRIANQINSTEYNNYAIGGASLAYRAGTVPTDDPMSSYDNYVVPNQIRKFIKDFNNGDVTAPDFICISALTNDVGSGHALGDVITQFAIPDVEDVDMHTIVGSFRWCITTLMETFPDVRIFVLTPLKTSQSIRRYELALPFVNKLKEVAERMSIPVIDCFGESLINEVNEVRYMQSEGGTYLHPNTLGQQMQFLYVYRELKNIYYSV